MTTPVLIRPDLQALLSMSINRLNTISEAVAASDKPLTPKVAKHAREAKGLILLIIQEINHIREAEKAAPVKKTK